MIAADTKTGMQQVIPRWMGYYRSIAIDELGRARFGPERGKRQIAPTLALGLKEFAVNPQPRLAADLFERLFLSEHLDEAKTVAKYLITQKNLRPTIKRIAEAILNPKGEIADVRYELAIKEHREKLRDNPRNGLRWVELARLYTIKRRPEKARDALRIALQLNPYDRYTVRSAIRFYIHVGELDAAAGILARDLAFIRDPWLKGVGLSALLLAKRSPKRRMALEPHAVRPADLFDSSELLAASGMLEMVFGKEGKAKQFFRRAWVDPSGNVTTHAEWLTRSIFPGLRDEIQEIKRATPEARAGLACSKAEWEEGLSAIEEWRLEEPYSRRPLRFLAAVQNVRGRFLDAVSSVERAEKEGPLDFGLRVSRIYALLCLNRIEEAALELKRLGPIEDRTPEKVVLLANQGLLLMRSRHIEEGIKLYARAEAEAKEINERLALKVRLNAVVGKKMVGAKITEEDVETVKEVLEKLSFDIDTRMLAARVDPGLIQNKAKP